MSLKNVFYAQSGGPTAVINTSACAVIQQAQQYPEQIGKVLAGHNGIIGALNEELIDTSLMPADQIDSLKHRPGCAFGSCRYKLKNINEDNTEYQRLIDVFKAHEIGYFFYNGGGDSQDTAHKIAQLSQQMNYPLICIGIPKTIDNDLPFTDSSPGFGSTAKYISTSIMEASLDVAGMCASSTKVFILEVMGRHAGWIAASAGLAQKEASDSPHIILFPETPFDQKAFINKVKQTVEKVGYCSIVVSEGVKHPNGRFLSESNEIDAFGHHQLGGVAPIISRMIQSECQLKCHWAVSDYLQRSARHLASQTDVEHAYALGKAAIDFAIEGANNVMLTIDRQPGKDYQWSIGTAPLEKVANAEKTMPADFIREDGFGITDACREYMLPLIQGEAFPPFINGIPDYRQYHWEFVEKKCAEAVSI